MNRWKPLEVHLWKFSFPTLSIHHFKIVLESDGVRYLVVNERGVCVCVHWQWTIQNSDSLRAYAHTIVYLRARSTIRWKFIWKLKFWYNFNDRLCRSFVSHIFFRFSLVCAFFCVHKNCFRFDGYILNVTLNKHFKSNQNWVNIERMKICAARQQHAGTTTTTAKVIIEICHYILVVTAIGQGQWWVYSASMIHRIRI